MEKKFSPSGNWTPVSRVTGGDTYHYTNEDMLKYALSKWILYWPVCHSEVLRQRPFVFLSFFLLGSNSSSITIKLWYHVPRPLQGLLALMRGSLLLIHLFSYRWLVLLLWRKTAFKPGIVNCKARPKRLQWPKVVWPLWPQLRTFSVA